jgi:hypothetical protein
MKEDQLSKNALHYSRVLRMIWLKPGISRIAISKALNLDRSIVTHIVTDLMEFGIVKLKNPQQEGIRGGRRPIPLIINKDFGCIAGLEIQPDYIKLSGVNLDGEILFSKTFEKETSASSLFQNFYAAVAEAGQECKTRKIALTGIAAGLPGVINVNEGVIAVSAPLNIHKPVPFVQEVKKKLDVPVLIDNEANCCAWGELVFGKEREIDNFLFLLTEFREGEIVPGAYSSISIGLGIVIGQKVHYGRSCSAGELRSLFRENPSPGQLSLSDGDLTGIRTNPGIQKKVIREIARHIAFLANTFALTKIIIASELDSKQLIETMETEIRKNLSYPDLQQCRVEMSSLGKTAVAYGASGMFIENLFSLPILTIELHKDMAIGLESLPGWHYY